MGFRVRPVHRDPAPSDGARPPARGHAAAAHPGPRRSTEIKAAFETTEFLAYIASVAGVLIASAVVGTTHAHADYFRADKAWLFIVLLTIGYAVSRGLAKSGRREHHTGS
jgi:hypothetical protein